MKKTSLVACVQEQMKARSVTTVNQSAAESQAIEMSTLTKSETSNVFYMIFNSRDQRCAHF